MTDSKAPANPMLKSGVRGFKQRGKVPPGVIGRRRVLMAKRELTAALEEIRPDSTPQERLLINQVVRQETIQTLGFDHIDRFGIYRPDRLREGVLEFQPIVRDLLTAMNCQRQALQALGLDRRKLEEKTVYPWEDDPAPVSQAPPEPCQGQDRGACCGACKDKGAQGEAAEGDDDGRTE